MCIRDRDGPELEHSSTVGTAQQPRGDVEAHGSSTAETGSDGTASSAAFDLAALDLRRATMSPRMKTTRPVRAMPVNMNHCTAYQKCGPSSRVGVTTGTKGPSCAGAISSSPM